jgi:hypothetical protein
VIIFDTIRAGLERLCDQSLYGVVSVGTNTTTVKTRTTCEGFCCCSFTSIRCTCHRTKGFAAHIAAVQGDGAARVSGSVRSTDMASSPDCCCCDGGFGNVLTRSTRTSFAPESRCTRRDTATCQSGTAILGTAVMLQTRLTAPPATTAGVPSASGGGCAAGASPGRRTRRNKFKLP